METEPVVAASVARGAGGVVCEEALAAAFEGGGRKARSVVGNLDDEAPARDVAGDSHARAWIGNTYLDDSGRDSPASLNSTGDM